MQNYKTIEIYTSDRYIKNNPLVHAQDSIWKVEKIKPMIDLLMAETPQQTITILDVGGGAGIIFKKISDYIAKNYGRKIQKINLDISPGMLKLQQKNNLDLARTLQEDIAHTSLKDKEIDLVLMIDVLEHLSNPKKSLKEIKRISKFSIFKVPLEENISLKIFNLLTNSWQRKKAISIIGHVNFYSYNTLCSQIGKSGLKIMHSSFTNVFDYYLKSPYFHKKRIFNWVATQIFRLSPRLCSSIFTDFAIMLLKS